MSTQVGMVRLDFKNNGLFNRGRGLAPGQSNIKQATVQEVESQFESTQSDVGLFVQQQMNFEDKIIGTVGMRWDKSNTNGNANRFYAFPKASLAVNLTNFDFWKINAISQFKPRIAYGQTAGPVPFGATFTSLGGVNIGGLLGSTVATSVGNPNILPERAQEIEFGIDAGFLNNRILFEATYYIFNFFIKSVKDQIPGGLPIHSHLHEDFGIQLEISRLVSNLFNKYKIKNINKNKIFISKTKSDLAYKGFMKKKEELSMMYSGEEFLLKLKELQGDNEYNSMEFNNKIRVYENQDKVENFFKSLGYDIVYNEDIGLFDQMNMYHNATHIASINGTGCYNSIFADSDTKMFMINTHNKFYWFFDYLVSDRLGQDNVFVLPKQDHNSNEEISIDDILNSLNKYKEFM
jgi:hypothetical protein